MALAFRGNSLMKCRTLESHYNHRGDMIAEFVERIESLNFKGLSGPVKFSGADRIGDSLITQIQDGEEFQIAVYESENNVLNFKCDKCSSVIWEKGRVPMARRILKKIVLKLPLYLYYMVSFTSFLGICTSFIFLYFSLRFRRVRSLKLSSPKLNNVAVLGCILVYSSVILMEIDEMIQISHTQFRRVCSARVYLLSSGFSLIFGSIFAKTYRVHKLFNNCRTSVVKTKLLKDTHLIALILTPAFIDAIILCMWVVMDPLERRLHNLTMDSSSKAGIVYQKQVEVCSSNNTAGWFVALYGYKGLVLLMGVFVAWKNRHVKVPTLNNFKYMGICTYSVVFTAGMLILSNVIAEYVILSYLCSSCSIIFAATVALVFLLLPQFEMIFGRMSNDELIMQSMGLKFECNTRRLIHKDRKELLERLEIQNRVFKGEIKALDEEIKYLESLLYNSSSSSNIASSDVYTIDKLNTPELTTARASWPTGCNSPVNTGKRFASENRLNERFLDRFRIFSGLKKFLENISSIEDLDSMENNSQQNFRETTARIRVDSVISLRVEDIKFADSMITPHQNDKI